METYVTTASFTKPSESKDPGRWTFTPADMPSLEPDVETKYQFNLELDPAGGEPDWAYIAVSIHLRTDDQSKGDEPFITVRQGRTPSETYQDLFKIEITQFSKDRLNLVITNCNEKGDDVYLGLALTVTNGTLFRTSQDPQIRLRKR